MHCGRHGFVLRLLPGKVWGSANAALKILKYGESGAINVKIANIIADFEGYIKPTLHLIHMTQRIVEVEGEGLKPSGATDDDVTVLFTMTGRGKKTESTFRGTVVPGSYTGACRPVFHLLI